MTIEELFRRHPDDLYLTQPKENFELAYIEARKKENRLLSDALVQLLPYVPSTHQHSKEWKRRISTTKKFTDYLSSAPPSTILEIGCGNGWFSSKLLLQKNRVIGLDVGREELEQAARCFSSKNLRFICCNDFQLLPAKSFDIVVFNASLQYFNLDESFWKILKNLLTEKGEIHILDTPVYSEEESQKAKNRSKAYYQQLGVDLIDFYHPVHWGQIPKPRKIFYQPMSYLVKLIPWYSPFPWICMYKS